MQITLESSTAKGGIVFLKHEWKKKHVSNPVVLVIALY